MTMNPYHSLVTAQQNNYHRKYEGTVIDNKDPMKLQRVKIRVPGLHDGWSDEDLPWVARGPGDAGHSGGVGNMKVPPIGSKVNSTFQDNSQYHGTWGDSPDNEKTKLDSEFTGDDYPDVYGHVDEVGNRFVVNKKKGYTKWVFAGGQTLEMGGDGNIGLGSSQGGGKLNINSTPPSSRPKSEGTKIPPPSSDGGD